MGRTDLLFADRFGHWYMVQVLGMTVIGIAK